MIINTGQRTDIPAFYSEWFCNRLRDGYVLVRNPYNPSSVTRYSLSPKVVDLIGFCTKNPAPMLPHMDLLRSYAQYWFVTITPYGREIEPGVPSKQAVLESFKSLAEIVGPNRIGWRYDPIIITDNYPVFRHIKAFEYMARELAGYTHTAVISFIDLYEKTKRNFAGIQAVSAVDRITLGKAFIEIGKSYGMTIKPCGEGNELSTYGADCSGCMTIETYEKAIGSGLRVPRFTPSRENCVCYLSCDIGAYNTCGHFCRYCYANYDRETVIANMKVHDPASPLLIGHLQPDDVIHIAKQESWIDPQIRMDL